MAQEELHYCYNKGCGKKFNPKENNSDACIYHPGPPYFHDAYKIWNCCGKKSTDFGTWLGIPGCTRGPHSDVKPAEEAVKSTKEEKEIRPEDPEQVIVWSGLNKPASRDCIDSPMSDLKVETTQSALASIAKHREEETSDNSIHVGYVCQNPGCDKVYENEESNKQQCTYHSGIAIFHEGMKYWSCCERKTSDFGAFLEQKGCTTGEHKWGKNEKVSRIREDWFCRAGHIHLNIYCKGALPDKCYVKSNGLILSGKVVHGFGTKSTDLNYELFGEIVPSESKVIIGERKLEIILKQAGTEAWPRLTYETKIDERAEGDNAA